MLFFYDNELSARTRYSRHKSNAGTRHRKSIFSLDILDYNTWILRKYIKIYSFFFVVVSGSLWKRKEGNTFAVDRIAAKCVIIINGNSLVLQLLARWYTINQKRNGHYTSRTKESRVHFEFVKKEENSVSILFVPRSNRVRAFAETMYSDQRWMNWLGKWGHACGSGCLCDYSILFWFIFGFHTDNGTAIHKSVCSFFLGIRENNSNNNKWAHGTQWRLLL